MTTTHTYSKQLHHQGHVHRFLIANHGTDGWEVREERDSAVIHQARYTDWHRVERARTMMVLRVSALEEDGWTEA